jgi:hypothetical protein
VKELVVLFLLVIFLVLFVTLTAVLWISTQFGQGLFYSEPVTGLSWRAPAAGGAITALLVLWCFLDYAAYDPSQNVPPYDTLFRFTPEEIRDINQFSATRRDEEVLYTRRRSAARGADEFVDSFDAPFNPRSPLGVVQAIDVEDAGGKKARFVPQLTADGKFRSTASFPPYYEKGGWRRMESLGRVSTFHYGQFLMNLVLNLLHAALWFACFWYLLEYLWPHALLLAAVVWLAMTIVVLPPMLEITVAARDPAKPKPKAALHQEPTVVVDRSWAKSELDSEWA